MRLRSSAASGLRLCTACCRELRASLLELPRIYDDCEPDLLPRRNPAIQRVSGSRQATGIVVDEEAMTTRTSILGFLASWSALVADERHVAKPGRRSPGALTVFLVEHFDWLLAHPVAADFAEEISQIARRARRSAYGKSAQRFDLGQCVHPECNGVLSTAPHVQGGRRTHEVRCTAGHSWPPHQWLQLLRQIQQNRSVRSTAEPRQPEGAA